MEGNETIKAGSKQRSVFETLRRDLLSGRYASGKFPSERMLMARFHASRGLIRHVMRELMFAGFINARPRSGYVVSAGARNLGGCRRFQEVFDCHGFPVFLIGWSVAHILHFILPRNGPETPCDALNETASGALTGAYGFSSREAARVDIFSEDGSSLAMCRAKSGMDEIVSAVENLVVSKKSKSVLVDNGAQKMLRLIETLENKLKSAEVIAEAEESTVQVQFEQAAERLNSFVEFCDQRLEELRTEKIDFALAEDYWDKVIASSMEEVAEKAARQIAKERNNENGVGRNEQIINDAFAEVVNPKAVQWVDGIRNDTNRLFEELIGRKVRQISNDTSRQWEMIIQGESMISGLPPPIPVGGMDVMCAELIESVVARAPGVSTNVVAGTTIGVAVGAMIGNFVFPFVGACLGAAIGGVVGAIGGGGVGEENREQKIYEGVKRSLKSSILLQARKEEVVTKQAKRIESLRMGIVCEFQNAFNQPMEELKKRYADARNLLREHDARRHAIAAEHRRIRLEQLEPLRKDVCEFMQEVSASLLRDGRIVDDDFMRSI